MATPEKPETPEKRGLNVNPLRVLIDPSALPRDALPNRILAVALAAEEVALAAIFIYIGETTEKYAATFLTYMVARAMLATAATGMLKNENPSN